MKKMFSFLGRHKRAAIAASVAASLALYGFVKGLFRDFVSAVDAEMDAYPYAPDQLDPDGSGGAA